MNTYRSVSPAKIHRASRTDHSIPAKYQHQQIQGGFCCLHPTITHSYPAALHWEICLTTNKWWRSEAYQT